jgi:two-component system response regulator YesN
MMRVLLVDDELIVRAGLKAIVNWKECAMEVVAEASNGQNALKIIEEQPIDVVISDIRMPIVDGIELTRRVREKYPKTKMILLTCYNDFKYVQEALEIGASGYVLKTDMEDGSLEKILQKVRKEWEQENVKKEDYQSLQWKAEQSIPLLREKYIKSLLEKNDAYTQEQCIALGLQWLNQPHRLLLLEFESPQISTLNKIQQFFYQLTGEEEAFIFQWDEYSFLGLVKQPGENSQNRILLWDYQFTHQLFSSMKAFFENVNLYYCQLFDRRQIRFSFSRLVQVMEYYTFYEGFGHPLDAGSLIIQEDTDGMGSIDWQVFKQLTIIRNWSEIKEKCCEMFKHFNKNRYPVEYVKRCTIEMIGIITDVLQSNGSLITTNWGSNKLDYVERVKETKTILKLADFLFQGIHALEESRLMFIGGNRVIEKAVEYIERNYYKEITLDDLSNYVGLSKSYLSSYFKKVTGGNFIDYLIHLRIEKAKQLFRQTDLKTFEVAEKVGIQDPKYFTKLFKRIEGISPKTFKDIMGL